MWNAGRQLGEAFFSAFSILHQVCWDVLGGGLIRKKRQDTVKTLEQKQLSAHRYHNIKLIQQCRNQKKSNSFSVKSALWFPSIFNSNNIPYTNRIKNFSSIIKIFSGDKHSALNCNAAGITLLRGECWPPALEKNCEKIMQLRFEFLYSEGEFTLLESARSQQKGNEE